MTLENLKKHHAHLKWLVSGEFTERDFDYTIEASDNPNGLKGEKGRMAMGDMSEARRQLIMQDAKRTLTIFERKYPEFISKPETPKEKPIETTTKTNSKSKGKK